MPSVAAAATAAAPPFVRVALNRWVLVSAAPRLFALAFSTFATVRMACFASASIRNCNTLRMPGMSVSGAQAVEQLIHAQREDALQRVLHVEPFRAREQHRDPCHQLARSAPRADD